MSEPFVKPRPFAGDADLRATRTGPVTSASPDPLAELARLVGRDDPFRDLFPRRDPKPSVAEPPRENRPARFPLPGDVQGFDSAGADDHARGLPNDEPFGSEDLDRLADRHPAFPIDSDDAFGLAHQPVPRHGEVARYPAGPSHDDEFDDGAAPQFAHAMHGEAPPLNADLWAQGMPEPVSAEPLDYVPQVEDPRAEATGSGGKTLVVLAAVLALTAGGLGATFLVRGGAHATASSGEPPTIMADTAPTKVQPPDTSNASTGGDGTTALLEKSASDNVNNAKVVNTQERPIDLAQLPKAPASVQADDGRVASSTTSSPFPEPKKVKTIMIRPDGSVVGDSAAPAADPQASGPLVPGVAMPAMADPSAVVVPPQGDAVAKPATPKSTARVATTPKSTAAAADGVAAVKPKPAHPPKIKPVETADATPTPPDVAASTGSGGFAVQLAAPTSEQDAKDVMSRLQKKYADELGGKKPSIHKADKGDKTVYRVRVGNLSQDDAKALCSKLQTSGGSCFVVRN